MVPLSRLAPGFLAICLLPAFASAQPADPRIARALSAAPPMVSEGARVILEDGTELRAGTNGWTCLPTLGADHPACLDEVWLRFLGALMGGQPFSTDRIGVGYMLQPEVAPTNNADPADRTQDPGEVWIQEGPHLMLLFPNAQALESFPTDPWAGGPYVMWKGTPYAHVMMPVGPRPKPKP